MYLGFGFFFEHWQKGHPSPSANAVTSLSPPIYIQKPKPKHAPSKGAGPSELAIMLKKNKLRHPA
jgi:hypothetical protein